MNLISLSDTELPFAAKPTEFKSEYEEMRRQVNQSAGAPMEAHRRHHDTKMVDA
jgi:hypothetical protein